MGEKEVRIKALQNFLALLFLFLVLIRGGNYNSVVLTFVERYFVVIQIRVPVVIQVNRLVFWIQKFFCFWFRWFLIFCDERPGMNLSLDEILKRSFIFMNIRIVINTTGFCFVF